MCILDIFLARKWNEIKVNPRQKKYPDENVELTRKRRTPPQAAGQIQGLQATGPHFRRVRAPDQEHPIVQPAAAAAARGSAAACSRNGDAPEQNSGVNVFKNFFFVGSKTFHTLTPARLLSGYSGERDNQRERT